MMENLQLLNIPNDNNKLLCDGFLQIHFAPAQRITERDLNNTYVLKVGNESRFFRLVDMIRVPFRKISSIYTIAAAGQEADEWCRQFKEKYPSTTSDTEMAVYMYKRKVI